MRRAWLFLKLWIKCAPVIWRGIELDIFEVHFLGGDFAKPQTLDDEWDEVQRGEGESV